MNTIQTLRNELSSLREKEKKILLKEDKVRAELQGAFSNFCQQHMPDGYYDRVNIRGWGIEDGWRLRKNAKVFIRMDSTTTVIFYPKLFETSRTYYNGLDSLINQGVSESEILELQKIFKEICVD